MLNNSISPILCVILAVCTSFAALSYYYYIYINQTGTQL